MCIFSIKSVIKHYNHFINPIYSYFLDAPKAFDKINHQIIFGKMIKRSFPSAIIRIILFQYQNQTACMYKVGITYFLVSTISDGTRRGSVLSPRLFSFYVDDLSHQLSKFKEGCFIDSHCMNHFIYADDICVLMIFKNNLIYLICLGN